MHKSEIFQEVSIDLGLPPEDRWQLTPQQCQQARELLISYKADLGLAPDTIAWLTNAARELVHPDHWSEMESLSVSLDLPLSDIALGNFYYDALKVALGCTAFAVGTSMKVFFMPATWIGGPRTTHWRDIPLFAVLPVVRRARSQRSAGQALLARSRESHRAGSQSPSTLCLALNLRNRRYPSSLCFAQSSKQLGRSAMRRGY